MSLFRGISSDTGQTNWAINELTIHGNRDGIQGGDRIKSISISDKHTDGGQYGFFGGPAGLLDEKFGDSEECFGKYGWGSNEGIKVGFDLGMLQKLGFVEWMDRNDPGTGQDTSRAIISLYDSNDILLKTINYTPNGEGSIHSIDLGDGYMTRYVEITFCATAQAGASEVAFYTAVSAVPEPTSLAIISGIFSCLLRRKRISKTL